MRVPCPSIAWETRLESSEGDRTDDVEESEKWVIEDIENALPASVAAAATAAGVVPEDLRSAIARQGNPLQDSRAIQVDTLSIP